jgi:hypothetical protein
MPYRRFKIDQIVAPSTPSPSGPMPKSSPALRALVQSAEAAAASHPNILNALITTLNAAIGSAADPYLVSAALIEGVALTVAHKVPPAKQGEVAVKVVRLLRDQLRWHGAI